jgi:hypothetical protein
LLTTGLLGLLAAGSARRIFRANGVERVAARRPILPPPQKIKNLYDLTDKLPPNRA